MRLLFLEFFQIPLRQFPGVSLFLPNASSAPGFSRVLKLYPLPPLSLVLISVYELRHLVAPSTHGKIYHWKKTKIIFRSRSFNYQESLALLDPSNIASLVDQIQDSGEKKMFRKKLVVSNYETICPKGNFLPYSQPSSCIWQELVQAAWPNLFHGDSAFHCLQFFAKQP